MSQSHAKQSRYPQALKRFPSHTSHVNRRRVSHLCSFRSIVCFSTLSTSPTSHPHPLPPTLLTSRTLTTQHIHDSVSRRSLNIASTLHILTPLRIHDSRLRRTLRIAHIALLIVALSRIHNGTTRRSLGAPHITLRVFQLQGIDDSDIASKFGI